MKIIRIFLICFLSFSLNATEWLYKDKPLLEESFIKLVNKALDEYSSTTNEAKKTKIRLDLRKSSSDLLKDRIIKDEWVGEVIKIWTDNTDGSARMTVTLSIEPGKAVALGTADNKAQDDVLHIHTGIDIGSDLYNVVSELEVGDKVVFSGRFVSPWPNALIVNIFELSGGVGGVGVFEFTSIEKILRLRDKEPKYIQYIQEIALFLITLGILFYFLPSFIAFRKGHKNKWAIFFLNLFLGWSFIGWVVALVWSFRVAQDNVIVINNHNNTKSDQ